MNGAKQEVEALINELLPLAKPMLAELGEFLSYGGFLESDGTIVHVDVTSPFEVRPRAVDFIDSLREDFRHRGGKQFVHRQSYSTFG